MRQAGRLVGYGLGTWVIALAISMLLFPLKRAGDPLFETVMTLVVTALAVVATGLDFRRLGGGFLREGVLLDHVREAAVATSPAEATSSPTEPAAHASEPALS